MPQILINGCKTDQISVLDRGFQYGDGLFETIRVTAGKPRFWASHINRLSEGCARLAIKMPEPSVLEAEAKQLCDGIASGVLKITLTRGSGGRGYMINESIVATRVLALFPAPQFPDDCRNKGAVLRVCETRLGRNPALAGIKHLNRLEQVLARAEWNDPDIHEGLMLDNKNNIVEGTMSNMFAVKNNELYTPELSHCGVKGVIREQIIEIAKKRDIAVHETELDLNGMHQFQEVFLSNSLIGIWPVRKLEDQTFNIGPLSQQMSDALENA